MQLTAILNRNTVSLEPNVNSIIAKVGLGSADAGFSYYTDYLAAKSRLSVFRLPTWARPPYATGERGRGARGIHRVPRARHRDRPHLPRAADRRAVHGGATQPRAR